MARRAQVEPVTIPLSRNQWLRQKSGGIPFWLLLVIILLGGSLLLWALVQFYPDVSSLDELPFAVHSPLQADYSADLRGTSFAPVNLSLLADTLNEGTGEVRLATLINQLNTPVATITSQFPSTVTRQPSLTPTAAQASATQSNPLTTPSQTETAMPTPTASPTLTLPGMATARPMATWTARPIRTEPPVVLPSVTSVPPTQPPPPTAVPPTQPPPPTAVPPTTVPRDYPPPEPPPYPPPM